MQRKTISVMTALLLMLPAVKVNAQEPDSKQLYVEKEIYSLDFTGADTVNTVTASSTDEEKAILMTWQPSGLAETNIFTGFANGNAAHIYGVVKDDLIKPDDEILKLTATASATNAYMDIKTDVAEKDYYIGEGDLLSVSFDFYANGTKTVLRTGRTVGESDDGLIYLVKGEGQRLLEISSDAKLNTFGSAYGETVQLPMYSDPEETVYGHDNKWHNIELLISSENKYQIYFDGEALNDGQWFDFDTKDNADGNTACTFGAAEDGRTRLSFRGFTTLRVYNCHGAASGTQYFDNFRYTVRDNITNEYKPPAVSFANVTASSLELEAGEEYELEIEADSVCPDRIKVYLDDELAAEYSGKSCKYKYTAAEGMHTVSAEAVDALGEVSERCAVRFIVSPKIEIEGSFNGGETRGIYNNSDEKRVGFEAICKNGLDRIEFFINNIKVSQTTETVTEFDFSSFGAGELIITAVVYDSSGSSKSFDYTAEVKLNKTTLLWNEDYSTYTDEASSSIGSINLTAKNGYYAPVNVDVEHGTSLALGIEADNGSDTGAYANFTDPMGTAHAVFETEFYISDYPGEASAARKEIHFDMVESGSVQNAMFKINSSHIYKGSSAVPYETKKWYKLKIDFDMPNRLYSIYIDGEPLAENVDLKAEKPEFVSLNSIRCYGPGVETVPCFIAFDNTSLVNIENHEIRSVLNSEDSAEITTQDKLLKLRLTQGLRADSLSKDKVSVACELGKLNIGSVEYDNDTMTVVLNLADSLLGNKSYVVSISGDVLSDSGSALGSAISASFAVTDDAPVRIEHSQYKNGELSLYVSSDNEASAYFVVTAWSGKKYLGMKIVKATLDEGTETVIIPGDFRNGSMTLNVYILDSLYNGNMLLSDIYKLEA